MESGAITSYIDVAQLVLYAFWIFFFGLIFYLRREDKREGYPLESERSQHVTVQGFPRVPAPKTFRLAHGGEVQAPRASEPQREIRLAPAEPWPGAPFEPTGDPLSDGVGPASYAMRAETPDLTLDGQPRIVPLRVATEFTADPRDPELRGMPVYGADGVQAGSVHDVWVDRSEPQIRYIEVRTNSDAGERSVLMPIHSALIDGARGRVRLNALLGAQLGKAPQLASPDQVTLREEDQVTAFFAGGYLYAEPGRAEPLL